MAARQIVLSYQGAESAFDFSKISRAKLYGRRMRQLLDNKGEPCTRAALTADGTTLISAGMTAQGYFDPQGDMVSTRDLVGLDAEGQVLPLLPCTLNVCQELKQVDPAQLTDTRVHSVYALDPQDLAPELHDALEQGGVFEFVFNYRADFRAERGFLVRNDAGIFALIGQSQGWTWSELQSLPELDMEEDTSDEDSLDFGMF